jgi:hypothetical protein
MENKKLNVIGALADLSKVVSPNEFYSINIWPNSGRGEIKLQGYANETTFNAAKKLGITLEFDNECNWLRGNDGFYFLTLTY